MPLANAPHRVVIIGAGFGGLTAAQELRNKRGIDVTIVDRRNHHLFQPLLYQVATTSLATSEVAWPIRHIMRGAKNVRTLLGTVNAIDPRARNVMLEDGAAIPYDSLIVATGARHAYFGHDEWAPFAPGLKTLEDATTIRRKLLLAFERAEREPVPAARQALLTFVIVGGGATGVELAGAIAELARDTLRHEFKVIQPEEARVILIEGGERLMAHLKPELSAYAKSALEKLGAIVELGAPVTEVTGEEVVFNGRRIHTRTVLWAAGVQSSPAALWLHTPADKAGRVQVEPDLSVPGHPEVFVVGDAATAMGPNGKPVPGISDAAKQGGRHAARTILQRLRGKPSTPFAYRHFGDAATIGKRAAVLDFGWIKLTGWVAWWGWGLAHIYFLIGVRNRIFVALSWLWIYLLGRRSSRLITQGDAQNPEMSAEHRGSAPGP